MPVWTLTSPICRARPTANWISRKDFFGREAFLTVSGQPNIEAYSLALTKAFFDQRIEKGLSLNSRDLGSECVHRD